MKTDHIESLGPEVRHFRLLFYAAVLNLLRHAVQVMGDAQAVAQAFPFLSGYTNEIAGSTGMNGIDLDEALQRWRAKVQEFEDDEKTAFLPMRGLRQAAALDWADQVMLAGAGLIEEDLRFGAIFEALHGANSEQRPSASLLASWEGEGSDHPAGLSRVRRLVQRGLLSVVNPSAPLPGWGLRLADGLAAALRGEAGAALPRGMRLVARGDLPTLNSLLLEAELRERVLRLPGLLKRGRLQVLVVRGFARNGRRTVTGAVARAAGLGMLEIDALQAREGSASWHEISALAAALNALPVILADPGPGGSFELPASLWSERPVAVLLGRSGGVAVPRGLRSVSIELPLPVPEVALKLWARALPQAPGPWRERLAAESRLASGAVIEIAALAQAQAAMGGHAVPTPRDLRVAARALGREALDALAVRTPDAAPASPEAADSPWDELVVNASTLAELHLLEQRCRLRQSLGTGVSVALAGRLTPGVKALLRGPSGTGKSLAARLLAEALGKDLYVCNLATVVSKYIGETEKRLADLLDAAEAMDVILTIEEADSLFARRSETVKDSTDRYANMETGFLLQRMEAFGGILLLTTNLFGAIDTAFIRRFDSIIDFAAPGPADRMRLLREHLPAVHDASPALLQEIAIRCDLTGGQLRNVVLDAALLAREGAARIGDSQLGRAVQLEYRRTGGVCLVKVPAEPLRAADDKPARPEPVLDARGAA